MEVDQQARNYIPYMGTKNLNVVHAATMANTNPKSVADAYSEFKEYKQLKKKDENQSNQESGTKAFLVSRKWVKQYEKYILYDQFNYGYNESRITVEDDHFTKLFPGPITNTDLLEEDKEMRNVYGTDKVEKQQKEYADQYLDTKLYQQQDYVILNEELWDYLLKRYGGNPIMRFYSSMSSSWYTNVETKLYAFKVSFLNANKLKDGSYQEGMFKNFWTQISKKAMLTDVKKRCVDHLQAAGLSVTGDDCRLWLYTHDA